MAPSKNTNRINNNPYGLAILMVFSKNSIGRAVSIN
jgi:hypothetical protein